MSDYRELVKRLRDAGGGYYDGQVTDEAATAIETLEADLAAARDESAALREALHAMVVADGEPMENSKTRAAMKAAGDALDATSAAGTAWRAQVEREAARRENEACEARARQSACLCALVRDNHPERISRGGQFGIEHKRHLSECPHAIAADIAAHRQEKTP